MALLLRLIFLLLRLLPALFTLLLLWNFFNRFFRQGGRQYHYDPTPPGGGQGPFSPGSSREPKDPYSVLGCAPSSSDEEIRKCYREMLSRYHPDKFIGQKLDPEFIKLAERKFQEIQEAYESLRKRRGF
ncbi:MAG: DnaJ domain-containing protein [Synergistaceae bacterium]|nr:DnaJ domain-containing protein [Synergistaceae bacterium]